MRKWTTYESWLTYQEARQTNKTLFEIFDEVPIGYVSKTYAKAIEDSIGKDEEPIGYLWKPNENKYMPLYDRTDSTVWNLPVYTDESTIPYGIVSKKQARSMGITVKKTEQPCAILQEEFVAPVTLYDKRDHEYMTLPYVLKYKYLHCNKKTGLVCRSMLEEFNYDVKNMKPFYFMRNPYEMVSEPLFNVHETDIFEIPHVPEGIDMRALLSKKEAEWLNCPVKKKERPVYRMGKTALYDRRRDPRWSVKLLVSGDFNPRDLL
jgi:hypothetical protein